jgi:hypothetical protein
LDAGKNGTISGLNAVISASPGKVILLDGGYHRDSEDVKVFPAHSGA